jgi:hypothetical protein
MYGSKWQTQYNKQKLHGKEKKRQLKKIERKNEKKLEIFVLPQSKGI